MSTERDPDARSVNRRTFMRNAGAAAAGMAALAAGADAFLDGPDRAAFAQSSVDRLDPAGLLKPGVPSGSVLEGDVVSIGSQSLAIRPSDATPVAVELAPNANISREGPAPLGAYNPGDEVVVLGDRRGDQFAAVGLAAVFRIKDSTLYSRKGNVLQTSDGNVILTPNTEPRGGVWNATPVQPRPLAELRAGDQILVMGLENQKSGVMIASRIGVLTPEDTSSIGR